MSWNAERHNGFMLRVLPEIDAGTGDHCLDAVLGTLRLSS